ncbi:hypothetical protein [Telluribacter sp. SYSU D00476]|uniref:hypothetical protein n=1 Tax=Telluribacter sp. SYSU D00476 TaxID=2811430 RepID=UPI001FF68904|nr:hypothetical protein [Telluribacter sp. SYSU D00476]
MDTLEQKRLFTKKIFTLKDDEVEIYDKSVNEEVLYSIDYLELGVKVFKKSDSTILGELFISAFFFLEFGMLIYTLLFEPELQKLAFWSLASAFFLGVYLVIRFSSKKKMIYLSGGQKVLELFQESPNQAAVDYFIEEIIKNIKKAHKAAYLTWEDNTPLEVKKSQIEYLKRIKIISEDEMNSILTEIDQDTEGKPIGF